ncbi:unnamed protein product, partial [marine sediment metagenome]
MKRVHPVWAGLVGKDCEDQMKSDDVAPLVSIVIPMRNEEDYIQDCLESIFASTYPPNRLEVIVADGRSGDDSCRLVMALQQQHPNLRLVDNPGKVTPVGLNVGIREAKGSVVVIFGAHAVLGK